MYSFKIIGTFAYLVEAEALSFTIVPSFLFNFHIQSDTKSYRIYV